MTTLRSSVRLLAAALFHRLRRAGGGAGRRDVSQHPGARQRDAVDCRKRLGRRRGMGRIRQRHGRRLRRRQPGWRDDVRRRRAGQRGDVARRASTARCRRASRSRRAADPRGRTSSSCGRLAGPPPRSRRRDRATAAKPSRSPSRCRLPARPAIAAGRRLRSTAGGRVHAIWLDHRGLAAARAARGGRQRTQAGRAARRRGDGAELEPLLRVGRRVAGCRARGDQRRVLLLQDRAGGGRRRDALRGLATRLSRQLPRHGVRDLARRRTILLGSRPRQRGRLGYRRVSGRRPGAWLSTRAAPCISPGRPCSAATRREARSSMRRPATGSASRPGSRSRRSAARSPRTRRSSSTAGAGCSSRGTSSRRAARPLPCARCASTRAAPQRSAASSRSPPVNRASTLPLPSAGNRVLAAWATGGNGSRIQVRAVAVP